MKKFIYLIVLFVFTTIMNATETVTFSGRITNTVDRKLKIRGDSFEKIIDLQPDGSFSETLNIKFDGSYWILTSKNRAIIYLGKASKLNITADDDDFAKTLTFTGKGAVENTYLMAKATILSTITNEDLYGANEEDFLKKIKEINIQLLENYNNSRFDDGEFKAREYKNLDFQQSLYLLNYPKYHEHYAKIEGFKTTESFPKFNDKTDLDNEADYLFSSTYKDLVNIKFNENIEKQTNPGESWSANIALPEIKKYKSQSIRNGLAKAISYEIGPGNPNSENLYNELMGISSSDIFKKELTEKYEKIKVLLKGKMSPQFDYENHKGGKTSLASLKGKYVYIDVWATWCGPCRQEIPSLQKVEAQYHGKNIEFVSMSIDARKDYDKWKAMVTEKQLGGIQVIADNDWNSQFVKDYAIDGIPRFIIVGPDGNIVNADAPRPSDAKLISLFNDLKI